MTGERAQLATMIRARLAALPQRERMISASIDDVQDPRLAAPAVARRSLGLRQLAREGEGTGGVVAAPAAPSRADAAGETQEQGLWRRLAELHDFVPGSGSRSPALRDGGQDASMPGAVQRILGPGRAFSISRLERYASCPWRFMADRLLGAQPRERWEADPRVRGELMHATLEQLLGELARQLQGSIDVEEARARLADWQAQLEPARIRAEIERLIASDGRFVPYRSGAGFAAERRAITARLVAALPVLVAESAETAWLPWALESRFDIPLAAGLSLRGIIDRSDRQLTQPPVLRILDYKSGAGTIDWARMADGLDLQLLSYVEALATLHPEAEVRDAGFVSLRGTRRTLNMPPEDAEAESKRERERLYGAALLDLEAEELALARRHHAAQLRRHARGILAADFPVRRGPLDPRPALSLLRRPRGLRHRAARPAGLILPACRTIARTARRVAPARGLCARLERCRRETPAPAGMRRRRTDALHRRTTARHRGALYLDPGLRRRRLGKTTVMVERIVARILSARPASSASSS